MFVLFWALYRLAEPLRGLASRVEEKIGAEVVDWTVRGLKIAFVAIGAITVLEIWGIEVAPILAGLGLIGVAVALGAQDLFRNLIAGLLIIGERRLAHGEWIKIDGGVEGTVEAIGFRSTRVRQFDKAPIYVPNSKLSDTAVVNYTRMTHRRIYWMIGVEYRTTVEQLRRIRDGIETVLLEDDAFAHPARSSDFRPHRQVLGLLDRHHGLLLHGDDELGRVARDQGTARLPHQGDRRGSRLRLRLPLSDALRRKRRRRAGNLRPAGGGKYGRIEPAGTGSGVD